MGVVCDVSFFIVWVLYVLSNVLIVCMLVVLYRFFYCMDVCAVPLFIV